MTRRGLFQMLAGAAAASVMPKPEFRAVPLKGGTFTAFPTTAHKLVFVPGYWQHGPWTLDEVIEIDIKTTYGDTV